MNSGDRLELFALAEAPEAARLARERLALPAPEVARLEPAAVAVREPRGLVVALAALRRKAGRELVALEEELPEPFGDGALVREPAEEEHDQVLVHFALQLELELCHRPVAARARQHVEEVAHFLGEGGEGAQVRAVEPLARVGALEAR